MTTRSLHPARRHLTGLIIVAFLTSLLVSLTTVGSAFTNPAAAAGHAIGPGTPSEPGFVGYVLRNNGQLGIARLGDGTYAVCIDTGDNHPWPSGTPPFVTKNGPIIGYLLSEYMPTAKNNPYYAAALWWVLGLDEHMNSNPAGVRDHVTDLKNQDPAAYKKVAAARATMLKAAKAHAAPSSGYKAAAPAMTYVNNGGTISNIGFKDRSGHYLAGYGLTVTLNGDAKFANGNTSVTIKSDNKPLTLKWNQTGNHTPSVKVSLTGAPADRYRLYQAPSPQQRTLAVADRADHTASAALADGYVRVLKIDGDSRKALAGADFRLWRDSNRNKKRDTGEWATTSTTGSNGYTTTVTAYKGQQVCALETAAPTDYKRDPSVQCVTAGRTKTSPVTLTVKNDKVWQPTLVTKTSSPTVEAGTVPTDTVTVASTGGHTTTMTWTLYGPLTPDPAVTGVINPAACTSSDLDWSKAPTAATGTVNVNGDGNYTVTGPTVTKTGCYSWAEALTAQPLLKAATSPVGQADETFLTFTRPSLVTQINTQRAVPGATLVDTVTVKNTANQHITGTWRLYGPVAPLTKNGAYTCVGVNWTKAPVRAHGTFPVTRDGAIKVGATKITKPGCYTYTEGMAGTPTTAGFPQTKAGDPKETSLVRAAPRLSTTVTDRTPHTGESLSDKVAVSGTGGVTMTGYWKLLGPTYPTPAGTCTGLDWTHVRVAAQGKFTIHGDGTYTVGTYKANVAGCYTYTESLTGTVYAAPVAWTRPGIAAETVGVAPSTFNFHLTNIHSGGESPRPTAADIMTGRLARAAASTVSVAGVGMRASLTGVRANADGYLLPPNNINVGGWYTPSQGLNAYAGTTLLVGHVSDDHDRPGQFKKLLHAKKGMEVVTTSGGQTQKWKITAMISTPKGHLPSVVNSNTLVRRLVMVTCDNEEHYADGGFHYRNNLTVVAVPVR